MDVLVNLVILLILIYIIFLLSYSMFRGAPFAAIDSSRVKAMIHLLKPAKGKRFLDLGSGDGRIVIEFSKIGLDAIGFEINPFLVLFSKYKITRNKSKAKIFLKDYWRENLEEFDYISVWGVPHMMSWLEKKLLKELKPGTKVVSNHLKFPNWKYTMEKEDVYLYIK